MKKQFLLGLMAMLLPLTAWAQEKIDIKDATVVFEYAAYAGTATEAPAVQSVTVNGAKLASSDYEVTYYTDDEYSNPVEKTAFRHAGTYYAKIKAKDESENYTGEKEVSFDIDKADLTLNVANTSKVYGEEDDLKANYTVSGYQPGDGKGNVKIEGLKVERIIGFEGEAVGSYTITLNKENARALVADEYEDYIIQVTSQASLTINPKPLTVTFENLKWTYGETEEKLEGVTVKGSGYAFDDTAESIGLDWEYVNAGTTVHDAGTYPIKATIKSKNYTVEAIDNIIVGQKELKVTVADINKTYGRNDPAFTPEDVDGWEYDDENSVKVTLTRESKGEDVGKYPISGCEVSSNNYEVVYNQGTPATLTINAKSLADSDITIEVAEDDKGYQGQQDNFKLNAITVKYTGKEVESIEETLDADTEYGFSINEVKNAGETVTVTVTPLSQNYTGTATTTFEIAKAPLDITINDQEFQYDATKTAAEMLQPDEYNVGDLQSGDSRDGLGIELYPYGDAAKGSVGTYIEGIRFKATGEIAKNYEFNPAYGTLTITGDPNGITLDGSLETDEVSNTVAAYNGKEVDVTIKKLTSFVDMENSKFEPNVIIKAEKWYTLALPFDVTVRELSALFGYAIVNVPNTDNADGEVRFKLTMQTVPANTLMAFKVDKDIIWNTEKEVTFEGKTIVAPTDDYSQEKGNLDGAGNKFIATYKKQHITEATQRYIFPKDGKFYPADAMSGGVDIYPLNGYVECVSTSARIYMEEPDGSTTAVSAITGEAINNAEGWYTIGGVKLNDIPTEKGIYINNGKKVVIK